MSARGEFNKPFTYSEGVKTDPTTATLLADTGAVAVARIYQVRIAVGCSVAAIFSIQHRNAANDATTKAVVVRTPAGASAEYLWDFDLAASERVRVLPHTNITGDAEAAINLEALA